MADQQVINMIVAAAKKYNVDPAIMLATSLTENGARMGLTPGDNGTSYGGFQWHRGGALGSHDPSWTQTQGAYDERAAQFAKYGVKAGKGAASVQRPADPSAYAGKVDSNYALAKKLLSGGSGGTPVTNEAGMAAGASVTPVGTISQAVGTGSRGTQTDAQNPNHINTQALITGLMSQASKATGGTGANPGLDVLAAFQQAGQSTAPLTGAAPDNAPGIDIPVTSPAAPADAAKVAGPQAGKIVSLAQQYIGTPYKWGGSDPKNGFDCSGFVQYLYGKNGISIPRTTYEQVKAGVEVPRNQLQPGDVIFFNTSGKNTHEGMYIGNGKFIQAPHTGDVVKISSLSDPYYAKTFSTARRMTGTANGGSNVAKR